MIGDYLFPTANHLLPVRAPKEAKGSTTDGVLRVQISQNLYTTVYCVIVATCTGVLRTFGILNQIDIRLGIETIPIFHLEASS